MMNSTGNCIRLLNELGDSDKMFRILPRLSTREDILKNVHVVITHSVTSLQIWHWLCNQPLYLLCDNTITWSTCFIHHYDYFEYKCFLMKLTSQDIYQPCIRRVLVETWKCGSRNQSFRNRKGDEFIFQSKAFFSKQKS